MSDEEDEVLQRMYPKEPHTEVPPKKEEQPKPTPPSPPSNILMVGPVEKSKKKKGLSLFGNNPFKSYILKLTNEPRLFLSEISQTNKLNYSKDIIINQGL